MDLYKNSIPVIDTDKPSEVSAMLLALAEQGGYGRGYVPRDYNEFPEEMYAPPSAMPLIPESEWDARYDEQEARKSSLEHWYLSGPGGAPAFVNLDQQSDGFCWAYSVGHAVMLTRLAAGMPLVRLNPHSTASIIKNGRNEGGWCGLSLKFVKEHGMAPEGTGPGQWPFASRSLSHDNPTTRTEMKKYAVTDDWYDLTKREYDQTLTRAQIATCGFLNQATAQDFNWWEHSVCGIRWVRIERGSWGPLILNSWKGWGRHGLAVLRGSQATANGAVAVVSARAS